VSVPPRWVRRVVLQPVFILVTALVTALSPLLLLVALMASPFVSGRWRPLRIAAFTILFMHREVEAILACTCLWLLCLGRVQTPQMQRRHYLLMRWFLSSARRWGELLLAVTVQVTDDGFAETVLAADQRPLLVLSRHSGPGDTFYLVDMLLDRYRREPRIVMKEILKLDPCIDLAGSRLPNYFVPPPLQRRDGSWESSIADLSATMNACGALLLFPEGGNFSEQRRRRRLALLLRRGRRLDAERAARMHYVIAPEPGGALTALNAAPGADVILIAHGGLSGLGSTGGLFRRAPIDQVFRVHLWHIERAAIPDGDEAQRQWLLDCWQCIDDWVATDAREAGGVSPLAKVPPSAPFDAEGAGW